MNCSTERRLGFYFEGAAQRLRSFVHSSQSERHMRRVSLSQGDARIHEEQNITRKYTFIVDINSNKIEIKDAIESIYNAGKKKKDELIVVDKVHTIIGRIEGAFMSGRCVSTYLRI